MTIKEIWKDIEGYEGYYQVSNHGRVKSLERVVICKNGMNCYIKQKILKERVHSGGYVRVNLCSNAIYRDYYIHRLVGKTFIPNKENKEMINHIDGNKKNNYIYNLEWCDSKHNNKHAIKIGLINNFGEKSATSKLTDKTAKEIYKKYSEMVVTGKNGVGELCKEYSICRGTLRLLVKGKSFKYLNLKQIEKTTQFKLNKKQVIEIHKRYINGEKPNKLAQEFGVLSYTIIRILKNGKWNDLKLKKVETIGKSIDINRLTEKDVKDIFKSKGFYKDIAKKFNIPTYKVTNIKNFRSYSSITRGLSQ